MDAIKLLTPRRGGGAAGAAEAEAAVQAEAAVRVARVARAGPGGGAGGGGMVAGQDPNKPFALKPNKDALERSSYSDVQK